MSPKTFRVPFRTLAITDLEIRKELVDALNRVMTHGQMILGEEVELFETAFAAACNVKHCIGVASGTSAIYLGLRALGIGPGDEVITTSLSWVATATAIARTGATPVFIDIRDDLNLDPTRLTEAYGPRTAAIVPVHYCGRICDMDAVMDFASANGLAVIEDAAQAFGAELNGIKAGAFGDIGAFSINPMKTLPSLGEAGAITFKNGDLISKLNSLRYLGTENREHCLVPELNHKMTALQAAFIRVFLRVFPKFVERRRDIAGQYFRALSKYVQCPTMDDPRRSVFFDYQIITESRDELFTFLINHDIEVKIRYPQLMPHHQAFKNGPRAHVPHGEALVKKIISLPMDPNLTDTQVEMVCDAIAAYFERGQKTADRHAVSN